MDAVSRFTSSRVFSALRCAVLAVARARCTRQRRGTEHAAIAALACSLPCYRFFLSGCAPSFFHLVCRGLSTGASRYLLRCGFISAYADANRGATSAYHAFCEAAASTHTPAYPLLPSLRTRCLLPPALANASLPRCYYPLRFLFACRSSRRLQALLPLQRAVYTCWTHRQRCVSLRFRLSRHPTIHSGWFSTGTTFCLPGR